MSDVIDHLLKEKKNSPAQAVFFYLKFLESDDFLNDMHLKWNIPQLFQKLVIHAFMSMLCDIFPFIQTNCNSQVSL